MAAFSLTARRPRGPDRGVAIARDPDVLDAYREDAAHFPGGHAAGVVLAASEADVAATLRAASRVLPVGGQSSLTGGATPLGDLLLATARLDRVLAVGDRLVRAGAGTTLAALDAALTDTGRYYPPAPTFLGACVGGTVATNAAGAATFKYGATRESVAALTVVLPGGDVLDIVRGQTMAHPDGYFELVLADRTVRVPVPAYRTPPLPKVSAGYFARPGMDLIDLFIGSEGTLGVITEVTLRLVSPRPAFCLAFVPFGERRPALDLVRRLRDASRQTWTTHDPHGIDVSAVEHMDARCLALLREDGIDRLHGVPIPERAAMALLITLELPPSISSADAFDQIGRARDTSPPDTPLVRFCQVLDEAAGLDDVEIAVPGDRARAAQLLAVREAVPAAVNRRVGLAKQSVDPSIEKTAADVLVPFERIETLLDACAAAFAERRLDGAVWGHLSDGNLHPNVIPRSAADVEAGKAAMLDLGRLAIRLGGSPLAEHGVGRNATKQQLVVEMYGASGVDAMRAVKRAIDPGWKLAPGVIFQEDGG